MREPLSTQGLAHLLSSGLLFLTVHTTPLGHFLNSFLSIESRRQILLIDLKADDRNLDMARPHPPGFETTKCQGSLRVRCCERACAGGKWLHESECSDHSHCEPLRTDTFSADAFFGNKLPHLVELFKKISPWLSSQGCLSLPKHYVPSRIGCPGLAVYRIQMILRSCTEWHVWQIYIHSYIKTQNYIQSLNKTSDKC